MRKEGFNHKKDEFLCRQAGETKINLEGVVEYPHAEKIVLTADCGGSNGNRRRFWKFELQKLANEINKDIQVLHYPPGTSKWNKIEHRMFSFISKNWQGILLVTHISHVFLKPFLFFALFLITSTIFPPFT